MSLRPEGHEGCLLDRRRPVHGALGEDGGVEGGRMLAALDERDADDQLQSVERAVRPGHVEIAGRHQRPPDRLRVPPEVGEGGGARLDDRRQHRGVERVVVLAVGLDDGHPLGGGQHVRRVGVSVGRVVLHDVDVELLGSLAQQLSDVGPAQLPTLSLSEHPIRFGRLADVFRDGVHEAPPTRVV